MIMHHIFLTNLITHDLLTITSWWDVLLEKFVDAIEIGTIYLNLENSFLASDYW